MIKIKLKNIEDNSYSIHIGKNVVEKFPSYLKKHICANKYVIITDSNVKKYYGKFISNLFEKNNLNFILIDFPSGEKNKNRKTKELLEDKILSSNIGKDCAIIGFGGGVVGDVSGFVAATLFRGVKFIQLPTTLISQCDSSIGGKTAVNHFVGKNLIGAYHQPKFVYSDINFFSTLSQSEFVNGIAEVIKQALIQDVDFFLFLEKNIEKILSCDEKILLKVIKWNCKLKAKLIEQDERESGIRKILNFGHTIGHSIETLSNYKLRHGYAISIGMVVESRIAKTLNFIDENTCKRIETILKNSKLPTQLPKYISSQKIILKTYNDKKNFGGRVKYSIIDKIGNCKFNVDVNQKIVLKVLNEMR